MRILKIFCVVGCLAAVLISCDKKNLTGSSSPEGSIAEYVTLSASGPDPKFLFTKESQSNVTYEYSNIQYDVFGKKVSFDLSVRFDNGHNYQIYCSNIRRFEYYNVTGYRAEVTAIWGGGTISGKLYYGDIIILSGISPSTGLSPGISRNFNAEVEYNLISLNQANINICFNDGDQVNQFYSKGTRSVSKGSGEQTFTVTVTPKDWGEDGDFKVVVFLFGEGHEVLSYDEKVLLFN